MTRPIRPITTALTGIALSALLLSTAPATTASGTSPERELPVAGVAVADTPARGIDAGRYAHAVHGVWRYDGGTVAYWSVRGLPDAEGELSNPANYAFFRGAFASTTTGHGNTESTLAVAETGTLHTTLVLEDENTCLCTPTQDLGRADRDQWQTVYATFAELPPEVTSVDLGIDGFGTVVHDVPVHDGPLPEPQVEESTTIAGQGWPAPPPADVVREAEQTRTGGAIWPLTERVGADDGSWTKAVSGEVSQIEISSDVLFEFDKADLGSMAESTLDDVAEQVTAAGVSEVTVVGHTDSVSDEAYNLELSRRRAKAVEQALSGRLEGVTLHVDAKGESEPIATNSTEAGRALNRRVTITYVGEDR